MVFSPQLLLFGESHNKRIFFLWNQKIKRLALVTEALCIFYALGPGLLKIVGLTPFYKSMPWLWTLVADL
jgi:hypothetical protein